MNNLVTERQATVRFSIPFFKPRAYINLAVLRLVAVSWSLFHLFYNVPSRLEEALALPTEVYMPLPVLQVLLLPTGMEMPSALGVMIIYWITVVFGLSGLIGFRTNLSLLIFAVGNIFLQAFMYSFQDMHHPEAVMMIALLALSLSPCGRMWSIDAVGGKGFNIWVDSRAADDKRSPFAAWPILLIQIFFALMYLSAVLSKHYYSGFEWANGFTLQAVLIQDGMRHNSPLALWLSQFHYFIWGLQIVVMTFQATFWLVIFFPRLRWVYLPLGLAFHLGIELAIKATFLHWIFLYVVFVPWDKVAEIYSGKRRWTQLFS